MPHENLTGAVEALAAAIASAYRSGALTSDAAEASLGGLYTADPVGAIWTVGVRSVKWYRFDNDRWQPADGAPDPSKLLSLEALMASDTAAAVVKGVEAFATADNPLPEPLTDPWMPIDTAPPESWKATHRVPVGGLRVWESPNAATVPFGSLAERLEVAVVERAGAWARVTRPGGSAGWVDGRLLTSI